MYGKFRKGKIVHYECGIGTYQEWLQRLACVCSHATENTCVYVSTCDNICITQVHTYHVFLGKSR